MVAVDADKSELLSRTLGPQSADVMFADPADVADNPTSIIAAWDVFLGPDRRGRPARGIGEPVRGLGEAALVESQLHEALLNRAFADADGFELLCPYDTTSLPVPVLREACCSHPFIAAGHDHHVSRATAAPTQSLRRHRRPSDRRLRPHARSDSTGTISPKSGPSPPTAPAPPGSARPRRANSRSGSMSSPPTASVTPVALASCVRGQRARPPSARCATRATSAIRSSGGFRRAPASSAAGASGSRMPRATSCRFAPDPGGRSSARVAAPNELLGRRTTRFAPRQGPTSVTSGGSRGRRRRRRRRHGRSTRR